MYDLDCTVSSTRSHINLTGGHNLAFSFFFIFIFVHIFTENSDFSDLSEVARMCTFSLS